MRSAEPVTTDIVLVGGGHAHVHVLTAFAMRPEPGVRLTLVARELETPYSGMLPGVVAGLYAREQAHIDLVRLATATGARLVRGEAIGLDRERKRILLRDRAPLGYDVVSLDVGATPALDGIAGAAKHAIAVKPIGSFLGKLESLLVAMRRLDGPRRVAVIGGGAGGVELLLSVRTRALMELAALGPPAAELEFSLITDGELLALHNPHVRAAFRRVLGEQGIVVHEHARAAGIDGAGVLLQDGRRVAADRVLVATQAAAPGWLAGAGLDLDAAGFVAVGPTLQSVGDPDVFAAGDCAALVETPREKAGVYAVRAGPPLAENLRLRTVGRPCRPWRPQRRHLALISTGERYAVASRGALKAEGAWLWTVKDRIDRRWMRMYQDTDRIVARMSARTRSAEGNPSSQEMRCGGCAAKVGPGPLSRALRRLGAARTDGVVIGLEAPDDAAVVSMPGNGQLVLTADFFRAFISDPYLLGEIAANHALNDVYAMGGAPRHALATAMIPPGSSAKVEEDLYQLLAGARASFDRARVALVGGHSSEGSELAIGFSIAGEIEPGRIARKGGLRAGDRLVLTKPLGTGILFAAAMRAKAAARSVEATIAEMRASNAAAAGILVAHGATAMTDVSGFGLAGHLGEMLSASRAAAVLDVATLPLYDAILELARAGFASTLLPENLALRALLDGEVDRAMLAILFDPQTAGGFIAGVSREAAEACVADLREKGYAHAGIIGTVTAQDVPPHGIRIGLASA